MTQFEDLIIKKFNEKFVQYDKDGIVFGGFEEAPYSRIKQFILSALARQREQIVKRIEYYRDLEVENYEDDLIASLTSSLSTPGTSSIPEKSCPCHCHPDKSPCGNCLANHSEKKDYKKSFCKFHKEDDTCDAMYEEFKKGDTT